MHKKAMCIPRGRGQTRTKPATGNAESSVHLVSSRSFERATVVPQGCCGAARPISISNRVKERRNLGRSNSNRRMQMREVRMWSGGTSHARHGPPGFLFSSLIPCICSSEAHRWRGGVSAAQSPELCGVVLLEHRFGAAKQPAGLPRPKSSGTSLSLFLCVSVHRHPTLSPTAILLHFPLSFLFPSHRSRGCQNREARRLA